VAVELPEREVIVYRFEELWGDGERRGFEIECSSGTYVRSLIADLGDAYCEELRRTRIGHFAVERADPERVIALDHALGFLPEVRLDRERALRLAHGRPVEAAAEGLVRATDEAGLIALAEPVASDQIRPVVGFRG
jgi:tRNA pseudouridine55 synthase